MIKYIVYNLIEKKYLSMGYFWTEDVHEAKKYSSEEDAWQEAELYHAGYCMVIKVNIK